jgi:hypothetical protein
MENELAMLNELHNMYSDLEIQLGKNEKYFTPADSKYFQRVSALSQIFYSLSEHLSQSKFNEAKHILGRLTIDINHVTDVSEATIENLNKLVNYVEENPSQENLYKIKLQTKAGTLVKGEFSTSEYVKEEYQSKINSIRNYFKQFGQPYSDDSLSLSIGELQVVIRQLDGIMATTLFYDFAVVIMEQIHNDKVTLKQYPDLFCSFEAKLTGQGFSYDKY